MKIRRKSAPLYLHVNGYRAADLFLPGSRDRQKKVNASLVVQLNSFKKRCKRKLDTSHPSWDETFRIPLRIGDYSDLLVLAVWNRSGGTKTYLGEVRIRVREIFQEGAQTETEPTWHKLYSSLARSGFITGSILLSFKLSTGKQKTALKATDAKSSRESFSPKNANPSSPPKLNVEAPTDPDLSIQNLSLSDQDICASFQAWT
ncbi:hypothetical protein OXX80_008465, partial [Metschnikowia pulcherrima]